MTLIEQIAEILESDGYQPVLASVDGKSPAFSPLVVPFRPDELGREFPLFIEVMPNDPGDQICFVNFSLIFPYPIDTSEHLPEAIRVLFLLNRLLPVGSYELCEQTPAIHYTYKLVVQNTGMVSQGVIEEIVGIIGYFARNHGRSIRQILAGEATCDELLDELTQAGVILPPLFGRALDETQQTVSN